MYCDRFLMGSQHVIPARLVGIPANRESPIGRRGISLDSRLRGSDVVAEGNTTMRHSRAGGNPVK